MNQAIVRMIGVEKHYGGIYALKGVSLDIEPAQVHALIGENGAGKSTLMKILAGIYRQDGGQVLLRNRSIDKLSIRERQHAGISMVHQEIIDFPNLNVAENIYAGIEPRKRLGIADKKQGIEMAEALIKQMGASLDPRALAGTLNAAKRQLTMIAKALAYNAELIIMDEPNSALTDEESLHLFSIINDLKSKGMAILYISHRLEEVLAIADRITVMRDGMIAATMDKAEATIRKMIFHMVGRDMESVYQVRQNTPNINDAKVLLNVKNITYGQTLHDLSFKLHQGEILGVAGLEGSGRTEMAEAIIGVLKCRTDIELNGRPYYPVSPRTAQRAGIGYVPPERRVDSMFQQRSICDNMVVSVLKQLRRSLYIPKKNKEKITHRYVQDLKIKLSSIYQPILDLSGGNQQKVILGRVLATKPGILIINEPTRGIDVGAKYGIYQLIQELADQGMGIILISSEMYEILGLSDRVLTFFEGRITGVFTKDEATNEAVLSKMMGG